MVHGESEFVEDAGVKIGDHEWIIWLANKTIIIPVIINLLNGKISIALPERED